MRRTNGCAWGGAVSEGGLLGPYPSAAVRAGAAGETGEAVAASGAPRPADPAAVNSPTVASRSRQS
jgi:hypothetical protein